MTESRAAYGMANLVMLKWLTHHVLKHGPLPAPQLQAAIAAKNDTLAIYRALLADHDPEATPAWFERAFRSAATRIVSTELETT